MLPAFQLNSKYLVAETLRGDNCDFIANSLVGLEVEGQLGVVSLNDDLGGLLNCLGTNATHDCGLGFVVGGGAGRKFVVVESL
jgi:hypothetical protein